ncbi:hypothetical protein [Niveispirillum sp.]|uniref:hypothetical protein n=1 Tax=Niveispirillum sp. TaxID=1917217 RepID=UPI001B788C7C|nr:hypothetical protein [Niveispirillum sp.]MBP7339267.1 hypothetical protein [Niveispirillum sp.]
MGRFLLWVEGVDFAATLFDTTDLSCIRGSGLALLYAPKRVQVLLRACSGISSVNLLFAGASLAALTFDAEPAAARNALAHLRTTLAREGADWARIREILGPMSGCDPDVVAWQGALPLAHLRALMAMALVAPDAAGDDGITAAIRAARADLRAQQWQGLGPPLTAVDDDAVRPDKPRFGGILPAVRPVPVPLDWADREFAEKGENLAWMSPSVAARRTFGRHMRQYFYRTELNDPELGARFVNSVDDIPGDLPDTDRIKDTLRNKLAVIYIDGNGFTKIREHVTREGNEHPLTVFANRLSGQQRQQFLKPMLTFLIGQSRGENASRVVREIADHDLANDRPVRHPALRFETLMWGGDEMAFALPAWLALWWVQAFFTQWAHGWTVQKHRLTHGLGMVICDRRTPLRQARAMAESLADAAKEARGAMGERIDALQIEIFESADLPDGGPGLEGHRASLYPGLDLTAHGGAFTLTVPELTALPALMKMVRDEETGLPRSQLHKQLRKLKTGAGMAAADTVVTLFDDYLSKAGRGREQALAAIDAWGGTRPAGLKLALLAQYWDYVDPFGDGWPDPPDAPADAGVPA